MSERERWIVYPLLFFALGAAIRDKLLQRVDAKNIRCESLQIVDSQNPEIVLAELAVGRQRGAASNGQLAVLRVDEVVCEGVNIADREDPTQLLVVLGTAPLPSHDAKVPPKRVGTLVLRDAQGSQICELRADQLINNRVVTNQLLVIDPVKKYPRFIAATQPTVGSVADGSETTLDHEGVLYLNNRLIDLPDRRPATKRTLPP